MTQLAAERYACRLLADPDDLGTVAVFLVCAEHGTPYPAPSRLIRILDAMAQAPALLMNDRLDVLAANALGRALYAPMYADPSCGANVVRFAFSQPRRRGVLCGLGDDGRCGVGALRAEAARNPDDPDLTRLVGELSTRSDAFRVMWDPMTCSPSGRAPSDSGTRSSVTWNWTWRR